MYINIHNDGLFLKNKSGLNFRFHLSIIYQIHTDERYSDELNDDIDRFLSMSDIQRNSLSIMDFDSKLGY